MKTDLGPMREQLIKTGEYDGFKAGYHDAFIVHEVMVDQCYDPLEITPEDVVLDLGGHIGTFAWWARVIMLARRVVSYEPFPPSFRQLDAQVMDTERTWGAVGREDGTTTLSIANYTFSASTANERVGRTRHRHKTEVPQYSFTKVVEEVQPTKIKIDIEGSEYDILDPMPELPSSVQAIAIEFHCDSDEWVAKIPRIWEGLEAQGFKMLGKHKPPKKRTGWPIVVFFRREESCE